MRSPTGKTHDAEGKLLNESPVPHTPEKQQQLGDDTDIASHLIAEMLQHPTQNVWPGDAETSLVGGRDLSLSRAID